MSISNADMILALVVVLLGAVGTYLMLPHRHGIARRRPEFGAGLAAASLALLVFLTSWTPPAAFLPTVFLYTFGITAILGALLTVTSRNPVYSALWFASVVLSTSGLFLLAGAPFLAAGTIIVYAGAIIVTFLFVIMLAQMEGKAVYDRAARAPEAATFTCYLIFWSLIVAISTVRPAPVGDQSTEFGRSQAEQLLKTERGRFEPERHFRRAQDLIIARGETSGGVVAVLDRASPPTSLIFDGPNEAKPNVAGLGASLYTDYLVTVGLSGALLFVALIGAVAITSPTRPGSSPDPAQAAALGTNRP
ncbi:MAG: NADH-quinone oxidoreductase subunit J [Isosphaeraceae bacterium]